MAGRWLETDSLSNQNISSALAIGAYTADADRLVICDVFLDQVAGGGDYIIYMTKQLGGAGSHGIVGPKTTITAAAGETALAPQAIVVTVRTGDVLTVYVDGLAGDTTTPDTTVRWFELAALQPTTAGRTLDVSATGEAGIDWANVGSPTTTVALTNTQINSVSGSIGGNVEGKVLGGGSGTITGVGASTDVTKWKGDVPRSLDVSGNVMASATIADKRMSGFVGASGVAEAIAFDATMSPGFIGQSSVPYSPGILYDNAFINWTFVIEDGNSGIAFATVVTSSDSATNTLSLRDPIPDPGFVVEDDIAFLLLPFAPFENALTAQETANAVHNLAPVGVAAAGSMGANLDSVLNGLTGVGLLSLVYTVTVTGTATPIEGVTVEVYTEEACLNCVRRGVTNSFGVVTFWMSTAGTYWIKCAKDGYEFDLDSETVSA